MGLERRTLTVKYQEVSVEDFVILIMARSFRMGLEDQVELGFDRKYKSMSKVQGSSSLY